MQAADEESEDLVACFDRWVAGLVHMVSGDHAVGCDDDIAEERVRIGVRGRAGQHSAVEPVSQQGRVGGEALGGAPAVVVEPVAERGQVIALESFPHGSGILGRHLDAGGIVQRQRRMVDDGCNDRWLELGVKPVGSAALDNGDGTHRFRRVDNYDTSGITFVGAYGEPDLELVTAQQPDLIIGTEFDDGIYPQLSQIAPTELIQVFDRPLTQALADFAEVVGLQERHAELHAAYEQAVAELIGDLPRPPEDIVLSYIQFTEDGQFSIPSGQAVGTVLDDIGFARPEAEIAAATDAAYDYSSLETLTSHDVDVMITGDFSADYGRDAAAEIAAARQQPVFQRLDVVQRGQFHIFDGNQMVGSAYEKMMNLVGFLRSVLVDRDPVFRSA